MAPWCRPPSLTATPTATATPTTSTSTLTPTPTPRCHHSRGPRGGRERGVAPVVPVLWTDEDEIVILRAFAEFTVQWGTSFASHQYDTTHLYEDKKIRHLKRKYRNCVKRLRVASPGFSFRSPQEQAIFEIAGTISRPASDKHGRDSNDEGASNLSTRLFVAVCTGSS